jgi:hypothetical protein
MSFTTVFPDAEKATDGTRRNAGSRKTNAARRRRLV